MKVATTEELLANIKNKGPDFTEEDIRDIGHVGRDEAIAEISSKASLAVSAGVMLKLHGFAGLTSFGVSFAAGWAGTWLGQKLEELLGAGELLTEGLVALGMRRVGQIAKEGPYASGEGHQVAHTFALIGFLASAVLGTVVAIGVGALVVSGAGLLVVAGAAAASGFISGFVGNAISKAASSLGTHVGPIRSGSPNVFIGKRRVARWTDIAKCSKDSDEELIIQGSDTIFVNNLPLARVGHKLLCGAVVDEGDETVIVDKTTRSFAYPKDEIPLWARVAVDLADIAMSLRDLRKGLREQNAADESGAPPKQRPGEAETPKDPTEDVPLARDPAGDLLPPEASADPPREALPPPEVLSQGPAPSTRAPADEARYDRYRRNGGELSYEEWYPRSQGGRAGGPGHQEIQNRLKAEGLKTEVEYTTDSGARYADAAGNGEIHQIGGLNKRGDPIARERDAINDIIESDEYRGDTIYFWDKNDPNAPPIKVYENGEFVIPEWGDRP